MPKTSIVEQPSIKVSVDFYSKNDRNVLLAGKNAEEISKIVDKGIEIPSTEFLTYFLFHRNRPGTNCNYQEFAKKIGTAIQMLESFVHFNGYSINWPADVRDRPIYVPENVGESVGISVMNRIHQLTEADWTRKRVIHGPNAPKVFDYERMAASDDAVIELETKGSFVEINESLSESLYQHKSDILKKKRQIRNREAEANDSPSKGSEVDYPKLRYGVITAVSSDEQSPIKSWLTDPPDEPVHFAPRNFRLLNRMRFLRDWIGFVSPNSQLAHALVMRVVDLEHIRDPFELDGITLRKKNGEGFDFSPVPSFFLGHSSFFNNKSRVVDGPAGGVVMKVSANDLFFLGLREEAVTIAAEQSFEKILNYRADVAALEKIVECDFSLSEYERLNLPPSVKPIESRTRRRFELAGHLYYSQEGLVFGRLPLTALGQS